MSDSSANERVCVARVDEIPAGKSICREAAGRKVLICNFHGTFRAVENICPHEKLPMDGGRLRGASKLVCPHHGSNFDLADDGKALNPPAVRPLTVFPVTLEGGDIYVELVEAKKPPADPWAIPGVKKY